MSIEDKEKIKEIKVIGSQEADWQKFKAIRLEALKNEPQAFGATYEGDLQRPDTDWQEHLENPNRTYSFLENNNEYMGMAGVRKTKDGGWMIIAVYLRKDFRGQGYAEQLFDTIEENLKNKNVEVVELMVNKEQEQAVNFYKKIGYEITGEEKDLLLGDGKTHDEFIMKKSLSSR